MLLLLGAGGPDGDGRCSPTANGVRGIRPSREGGVRAGWPFSMAYVILSFCLWLQTRTPYIVTVAADDTRPGRRLRALYSAVILQMDGRLR